MDNSQATSLNGPASIAPSEDFSRPNSAPGAPVSPNKLSAAVKFATQIISEGDTTKVYNMTDPAVRVTTPHEVSIYDLEAPPDNNNNNLDGIALASERLEMVGKAEADYVGVSSGLNLGVRTHKNETDKQQIGWWGQGPFGPGVGAAKTRRKVEVRLLALKGMLDGLEGPKAKVPTPYFPMAPVAPDTPISETPLAAAGAGDGALEQPNLGASSFDSEDTNIVATPLDDATMGSSNKEEETEAEAEEKSPTPLVQAPLLLRGISQARREPQRMLPRQRKSESSRRRTKRKPVKPVKPARPLKKKLDALHPRCM